MKSDNPDSAPDSAQNPLTEEAHSYAAISTILNSLDALVYVADMQTHELLFINEYGLAVWGPIKDKECYKVLQKGQSQACEFCTNEQLLNARGRPAGVHVWEFQNTLNGRWYQCRDQAIHWTDGRLVRMEIATDITDRKLMEQKLDEARLLAETRANTDELTGLNNRRAFFSLGRQVSRQAFRAHQKLSAIMFDLDFFKQINDRWGHAGGDAVLTQLARVARHAVRGSDVLARLGGEEFVVLLPDTDKQQALILAERIRSDIENQRVPFDGCEICCTTSLGIAQTDFAGLANDADPEVMLDDLLRRADQAMMLAKQSGRNLTRVAD